MKNEKQLPQRKTTRLKYYDYGSAGAYFVTVCTKDRKQILSRIVGKCDMLEDPELILTDIGRITEKYLLSSEKIPGVIIDSYIIMPDHIHAIFFFEKDQIRTNPTGGPIRSNEILPRVISSFKRFCNKEVGEDIFQRGYYEHVLRNREDYETRRKYMYENPVRRFYKYAESI